MIEDAQYEGPIPSCPEMLYDDVRAAAYCQKIRVSRKVLDRTCNVRLWLDQIENEGGKTLLIDEVPEFPDHYKFAWSTKFQLKIMENNKYTVCMNSTYMVEDSRAMRGPLKVFRNANNEMELSEKWKIFQLNFPSATKLIS
ncbi:hypothetical protein FBU30_009555 [Linnemannia zychae]|nr:hypothetical protein FBU30_009555 [Linnemannia zychae]